MQNEPHGMLHSLASRLQRRFKLQKAQGTIEYLMTYAWAILIIAIILAVIVILGLFKPSTYATTVCSFPSPLNCVGVTFATNGNILVNIGQSTASRILVTAAGCNTNGAIMHMYTTNDLPENVIYGGNNTVLTQCYENSSISTRKIDSLFNGYVIINYTDVDTGLAHTAVGIIVVKASGQVFTTTSTTTI